VRLATSSVSAHSLFAYCILTFPAQYQRGSSEEFCDIGSSEIFNEQHGVAQSDSQESSSPPTPDDLSMTPTKSSLSRSMTAMLQAVRNQTDRMLAGLISSFMDDLDSPYQGYPNPFSLSDTLDVAAFANVHKEDKFDIRDISAKRIVEVVTQPVTPFTVSDLFAAESCCLSLAANMLGYLDIDRFLHAMTLWCTIMFHIGVTADVCSVLLLLDEYGMAARSKKGTELTDIQEHVLLAAAEGRKLLTDNVKRVTSHTFCWDV